MAQTFEITVCAEELALVAQNEFQHHGKGLQAARAHVANPHYAHTARDAVRDYTTIALFVAANLTRKFSQSFTTADILGAAILLAEHYEQEVREG